MNMDSPYTFGLRSVSANEIDRIRNKTCLIEDRLPGATLIEVRLNKYAHPSTSFVYEWAGDTYYIYPDRESSSGKKQQLVAKGSQKNVKRFDKSFEAVLDRIFNKKMIKRVKKDG